jgi:hypothetical protein
MQTPHAPRAGVISEPLKIIFAILFAVVVPASVTLINIREDALNYRPVFEASPYGYTVSLLIYLVPIVTTIGWFWSNHPWSDYRRVAFRQTIYLLAPLGFALDVFLGELFLNFPNPGATLQFNLYGFSWQDFRFHRTIPIEEFVFYVGGFLAMLLVYIWSDEYWMSRYNTASDHVDRPSEYLLRLEWRAIWPAVGLIAAAAAWKRLGPHPHHEGFPLYFTFLVCAGLAPSLVCYRAAKPFINWQALSLTLGWVLLTSLLWEATLAMPFGWWAYERTYMMGIHVEAWHHLPIEAVFLWLVVTFATVIVYETLKLRLRVKTAGLFPPWRS